MTRVLVVDDEIDTLNLLRTILDMSGYQAITTLNSMDAITLAEIEHPDVILLDIMMPHLDGFTLCKMMRLHPATANLPIVFVTAYSSLDIEDRRKEAGADMILPKPIGMDVLIETVEKATMLRSVDGKNAKVPETHATDFMKPLADLRPTLPDYGKTATPKPFKPTGPLDIDIHADTPAAKPDVTPPIHKPDQAVATVKSDATPPIHKPDLAAGVKPDVTPPIHKPDQTAATIKPDATPPVNKPDLAAGVKPDATPPIHKPDQAAATVKPDATSPINKPDLAAVKPDVTPANKPDPIPATAKPDATPLVNKPDPVSAVAKSDPTSAAKPSVASDPETPKR